MLDINPSSLNRDNEREKKDQDVISKAKNLIGDNEPNFLEKENSNKLIFTFTLFALILVVIFLTIVYFTKETKASKLKTEERIGEELNQKLNQKDMKELNNQIERYSIGLDKLNTVMNDEKKVSQLLVYLEKKISNEVTIQNLSLDEKNLLKLTILSNDLSVVSKVCASLENDTIFRDFRYDNTQFNNQDDRRIYTANISAVFNFDSLAYLNSKESNE